MGSVFSMPIQIESDLAPALTVTEAAKVLNESDTSVYRRIWRGELRPLKAGGRMRIPRSEIKRLLSRVAVHTPGSRKPDKEKSFL